MFVSEVGFARRARAAKGFTFVGGTDELPVQGQPPTWTRPRTLDFLFAAVELHTGDDVGG